MTIGVVSSQNQANIIPKTTKIDGSIQHSFASFAVTETFRNDGATPALKCGLHINGGLNFIVYNVKALIDGKLMEFSLIEINEANEAFQSATAQSHVAGIGLKNESSDALHLEIGNVPAQSDFDIQFECSLCAILTGPKQLRFSIPRAAEAGSSAVDIGIDVVQLVDIESIVMEQEGSIFAAKSATEGRFTLSARPSDQHSNLDIVVNLVDPIETSAIATTIDGQEYAGIAAVADIPSKDDLKCEFYLVIDCSGSMSGQPIATARATLTFFLKSLPKGCLFNVIRFGTRFEAMFTKSVLFSAQTQQEAIAGVALMNADMSGTDLYSPLSYILALEIPTGYSRQVFVLTDGQVQGEGEIIALSTRHRRNHRIFSVGIGNSIDRTFIEDLAVSTGGESAFVSSSGDEVLIATMKQLKSALRPALVECQLHISDTEAFEVSPFPLPTLFHNVLGHVYIRTQNISEDSGILISGRAGDKKIDLATVVNRVAPGIRLDKFFAYFNIKDLEERIALAPEPEIPVVKERVVRLSMQTSIVSQFTALSGTLDGPPEPQQRMAQRAPSRDAAAPAASQVFKQVATQRQRREQRAWDDRVQGCQQVQRQVETWGAQQQQQSAYQAQIFQSSETNSPERQRKRQVKQECKQARAPPMSQRLQQQHVAVVPVPVSVPDIGSIQGIIALQTFDGYWDKDVAFPGFDRVPWHTFASLEAIRDQGLLELVQRTLYTLAVLEKTGSDKRVLWELVSEKAKEWLQNQEPSTEWELLIAQLLKFVP
jgi:hypothetical protein